MLSKLNYIAEKESLFYNQLTERKKIISFNIVLIFSFIAILILGISGFNLFNHNIIIKLISWISFISSSLFLYKQFLFFKYI
jgi:hypothetical protein